jgi:hypothetical protein
MPGHVMKIHPVLGFHSGARSLLQRDAVERAVLNRFAEMIRLNRAAVVEVRDRPRDLENPRVGARTQPQPVNRDLHQALAC